MDVIVIRSPRLSAARVLRIRLVVLSAAMLTLLACDPVQTMTFLNATDITVQVYHQFGRTITTRKSLGPGGAFQEPQMFGFRDGWNQRPPVRVVAEDQRGMVIFCREYRLLDLDSQYWTVVIVKDDVHCPVP
jgi:hypothetical protein